MRCLNALLAKFSISGGYAQDYMSRAMEAAKVGVSTLNKGRRKEDRQDPKSIRALREVSYMNIILELVRKRNRLHQEWLLCSTIHGIPPL